MKPQITNNTPLTGALLLTTALLSGCLATGNNATQGAGVGAALGCLGGVLISQTTGGKAGQGCALGAAIGGTTGYYMGRQKDAELASQARNDILAARDNQASVNMTVRHEAVPAANRSQLRGARSVEVVDSMVINVPQSLVDNRQQRAQETFSRVGGYVSGAQAGSNVIVRTRDRQDYDFIVSSIRSGYSPQRDRSDVSYQFAPLTRGTQASVEVVHPKA